MICTEIVSDIQNNFCTQHVLPMFWKKRVSDKDLPVPLFFRQMPWHSGSTNALGMELAVHYHILDGQRVPVRDRRKSAAILTIDSNNVNVIGPASIAQRLMFAAMAAAAAAPQNESSKFSINAA